jgi:two-component system alkaline phosphatase synthesis response regulator PhoP
MDQAKILVVDDEPNIVNTVCAYLEKDNFRVFTAFTGPEALDAAQRLDPDLIVLDIMLPGLDGLELLREVRQRSDVYVLMLTAKTEETDRIVGLTMGADDYMTKPFSPRELVVRVKAILRRDRGSASEPTRLTFERLTINLDERRVWKDGQEIELTAMEFELLHVFARHPRLVLSREQLIRQVWNTDYYGDDRVVDVHIGRLRKKIEDEPSNPTLITTVRGAGYRFEDEPV